MSDNVREIPAELRRLTYLLTSLNLGGAQAQAVALAAGFHERGWDVRVISMIPAEAFTDDLEAAGIPWASLSMAPGAPDPRGLLRAYRLLRQWRPVIVHGHMVHANLLARLVRYPARAPVLVSTAHSLDEGGRAREIAYRITDRLGDHTTNVSQAAVDRYIDVGAAPAHRISFIANGLNTRRFVPDPKRRRATREALGLADRFTWLAVGRIDEAKDYPNMLAAFGIARESGHDPRLLIAGDGPGEETLARALRQQGLGDSVRLLGRRNDVPDLMQAADAYLMSSAWEGLPMVLLEAAASGLPIVTTDVGGNAEVALDGVNALLAPAGDASALAERMVRLAAMSVEERRVFGHAGRRHVAAYELESVLDRWNNLYAALLERRGKLGPRP